MIRLRGGALLVVGVVLLFVALSFTGAVTAYATRHDGQTARLHTPVGVRLAQPIEDLKEPVAYSPSERRPLSVETPNPHAARPAPRYSGSWINGDTPPADTSTL